MLVVNAGSSSLKLTLLGARDETLAERELAASGASLDDGELRSALDAGLGDADVVGHRIVHGGGRFREPVRIDAKVESALRQLVELAPLHQPKSHRRARRRHSCTSRPCLRSRASTRRFTQRFLQGRRDLRPARRSGGSAGAYDGTAFTGSRTPGSRAACRRASGPPRDRATDRQLSPRRRCVSCARSLTAARSTPRWASPRSKGCVMATRSGSVDPGLLLWLLERSDLSERELASALEHQAPGSLGLAGHRRHARGARRAPTPAITAARLALEVYLHRLQASAIGAMAAALRGMDALVVHRGCRRARGPDPRASRPRGWIFWGPQWTCGETAASPARARSAPIGQASEQWSSVRERT